MNARVFKAPFSLSDAHTHTHKAMTSRTLRPVRGRSEFGTAWVRYPSARDAAWILKLDRNNILACCRGDRKRSGGYEFEWDDGEEWRSLPNGWLVSSHGRVKNDYGRLVDLHGTERVCIHVDGRLQELDFVIATAFKLPKEPGCSVLQHRDGDMKNNRLSNLSWVPGRRNFGAVRARLRSSLSDDEWMRFESVSDASRVLGLHRSKISACCHNRQRYTGDYEFQRARYTPDERSCESELEECVADLAHSDVVDMLLSTLSDAEMHELFSN